MYVPKVKFLTVEAHKAGAFETLENLFSTFAAQPGVEVNSARYFESEPHSLCGLLVYYDVEAPKPATTTASEADLAPKPPTNQIIDSPVNETEMPPPKSAKPSIDD